MIKQCIYFIKEREGDVHEEKSGNSAGRLLVVLAVIGGKQLIIDDSQVENTSSLTKEQETRKEKIREIYTADYQEEASQELEKAKQEDTYTLSNMLVKENPYGTNTMSLYVYFETEKPAKVSYTVHVDDQDIADFQGQFYQDETYMTDHEYQVIGLIPEETNEVTFTVEYEDGTSETKTISHEMGELWGKEDIKLDAEDKVENAGEKLTDGLYVILGNDSSELDFMYYYDNDGILRGEIPLIGYRSHRLLFQDDRMYYSISETKMAAVNRLGQVEQIYDLGKYELHHDYVFDDDGNLLILASDSTKESVEDMIIKVDVQTGEVTEVLDLADLFGSYKETCVNNSDGDLDWMHINTLQWLGDGSVILSSRETSTILKIDHLYDTPTLSYMIGQESIWEGTGYESYLLEKEGSFSNTGGQHSVTYVEDPSLPEGQYYLYLYNNNLGVSESQPDYDWSEIEGISESTKEGTSHYYRYSVDEKEGTYTLVNSFDVPFSPYVSSAQEVGDNVVMDSGMAGAFEEYSQNGDPIRTFTMDKEKFIYRVYKYDFRNFYFSANLKF